MNYPVIVLSQAELNSLPEYSWSLPTGTTIGKRWKCLHRHSGWFMGEYLKSSLPKTVDTHWSRIVVGEDMVVEAVIESILSLFGSGST